MAKRVLRVQMSDEVAKELEEWASQTGKPVSELIAQSFTLLKYAVDPNIKLIKEDAKGSKTVLKV